MQAGHFGDFSSATIIGKVFYVYSMSQDAIDDDKELIRLYSQEFGRVECTDGITRTGRILRNKKKLFKRRLEAEISSRMAQEQCKVYYTEI